MNKALSRFTWLNQKKKQARKEIESKHAVAELKKQYAATF